MCEAPNVAPLALGMVYFLYAFIQAIILVRVMDETCATGLMLVIGIVMAPIVTVGFLMQGCIMFTRFLLNVGRKNKLC